MAVIIKKSGRHNDRSPRAVQPIAFNLADMSGRAEDYLNKVRQQATQIVADAHQEAEQIRRQAEEAGKTAAQNAIEQLLEERIGRKMKTLQPAIQGVIAELEDARGAWQHHWEQSASRFAAAIAERIIRRELKDRPEIALEFVREGLELAKGAADVTVRLHPDDHAHLGSHVETLAATLAQLAPTDIVADDNVSPGGCRLDTQFGEIDLQIESQIARIEEELS